MCDGYWVGYTKARDKKYACVFGESKDAMKYIENIASDENPLRVMVMMDFHNELKKNFNVKYFDSKEDAEKFKDKFLS